MARKQKENHRWTLERLTCWQSLPFYPNSWMRLKAALKQALIPTLQEAGCEGMFETSQEGDPHKLVFFEIFSSSAAHKLHLEQDYMKRLFTDWKESWLEPRSRPS